MFTHRRHALICKFVRRWIRFSTLVWLLVAGESTLRAEEASRTSNPPHQAELPAASVVPEHRVSTLPSNLQKKIDVEHLRRFPTLFHSLTPAPGIRSRYQRPGADDDSLIALVDPEQGQRAVVVDEPLITGQSLDGPLLDSPASERSSPNSVSTPVRRLEIPLVDVPVEILAVPPDPVGETERLDPSPSGTELPSHEMLPPLAEELWTHGGSYLYCPEGDRLGWPCNGPSHDELLRLPEGWQKPLPLTAFAEFLGADPVKQYPMLKWFGPGATSWEPRLVGYGGYQVFGFGFEANRQRRDAVGHQLRIELDLRLTGTERFHVQFRPLGRGNSGGSFYQFNDPSGYVDHSTGEPQRYWIEGELFSILSGVLDSFAVRDVHFLGGKFPYALHNTLLINDEIIGLVVSKNTIYFSKLSNLNVQLIAGFNDVDTYSDEQTHLYGVHATADIRRLLLEFSYLHAFAETDSGRDADFLAFSGTKMIGACTIAARSFFKFGDERGTGDGQLLVLESNRRRVWESHPCGVEHGVFYANFFGATKGWNSLGGSNFNRLRSSFEVNPLTAISIGNTVTDDIWGASGGVQLFRHHDDESIVPEVAFQSVAGEPVWGIGLRYLKKLGPRTFFEALGVKNFSGQPALRREGLFLASTVLF